MQAKNLKTNKSTVFLIIIILVSNAFAVNTFINKTQYHIDEVWSYGLANSYDEPFLFDGIKNVEGESETTDSSYFGHWHSNDEFKNYLTVQQGERYAYDRVVYNQTCDVHPPLYYFIVHTICSAFPDTFSKWQTASINLVFSTLTILFLFLLSKKVLKSETKALMVSLLWGLSRAGISNIVFLRMYIVLTFFAVLNVYLAVLFYERGKARYLLLTMITQCAAFLTQYYGYIVAFSLSAAICLCFLIKKKYGKLLIYAASSASSVLISCLIFPSTIYHATQGKYSSNSLGLIENTFSTLLRSVYYPLCAVLQDYFGVISMEKMPEYFIYIFSAFLIFAAFNVFALILIAKSKNVKLHIFLRSLLRRKGEAYIILLITTFISTVIIGAICPNFGYFTDRYFFIIMPFFAVFMVDYICAASKTLQRRIKKKNSPVKFNKAVALIVVAAIVICGNALSYNRYLGGDGSEKDVESITENQNCYFVTDEDYFVHLFCPWFMNVNKVYIDLKLDKSLLDEAEKNVNNDATAYLIVKKKGYTKDYIENELDKRKAFSYKYEKEFCYGEQKKDWNYYYLYQLNYK